MAKETGFYSVVESDGAINKVLAPLYRGDPCKVEDTPLTGGHLEPATCTSVAGWAGKVSIPTTPLQVDFYEDGNQFMGAVLANGAREKAVCDAIGSTESPCYHGFVFNIPSSFKDGKAHSIDAYAINGADNPRLSGSGQTITCS
jgi:hypothetical protein